jgi:ataxia telangiectasia mutated family protein
VFLTQVVHIDLGIAFEQGLFLQTAERVPFRLTANIVDGMGAAGVEGTFRRCCETTMQVRQGSCVQHPGARFGVRV